MGEEEGGGGRRKEEGGGEGGKGSERGRGEMGASSFLGKPQGTLMIPLEEGVPQLIPDALLGVRLENRADES